MSIKMDNIDPDILKLAMKIAKDQKNKVIKKTCPAASKVPSKVKANEYVLNDREVYGLKEKNRTTYYSRCTRPSNEDSDMEFCWKHNEAYNNNADNIKIFKNIKKDGIQVTTDNPLKTRFISADIGTDPIISITVTKTLQKKLQKFSRRNDDDDDDNDNDNISNDNFEEPDTGTKSDDEVSVEIENDGNKKPESDIDEKIEEPPTEEETNEEPPTEEETNEEPPTEEETNEEEPNEEETECKEIKTKDKRSLYLDINNNTVYSIEDEGEGKEIGALMQLAKGTGPIFYQGDDHIVGKEYEDNKEKYIRCVLTDQLYKEKNKTLNLVGRLEKKKDDKFKIILSKTNKSNKSNKSNKKKK